MSDFWFLIEVKNINSDFWAFCFVEWPFQIFPESTQIFLSTAFLFVSMSSVFVVVHQLDGVRPFSRRNACKSGVDWTKVAVERMPIAGIIYISSVPTRLFYMNSCTCCVPIDTSKGARKTEYENHPTEERKSKCEMCDATHGHRAMIVLHDAHMPVTGSEEEPRQIHIHAFSPASTAMRRRIPNILFS